MEKEKWSGLSEFPRYSVSDLGRVRNDLTGRIMKLTLNRFGVMTVGLMSEGKQYRRSVPLMVANAFVHQKSEQFDTPICLDGDRLNCRADNLMWRPRWFAIAYNRQFDNRDLVLDRPIRDLRSGRRYKNSLECAQTNGLLERDLVLSILNRTYVWPTYQEFGAERE